MAGWLILAVVVCGGLGLWLLYRARAARQLWPAALSISVARTNLDR